MVSKVDGYSAITPKNVQLFTTYTYYYAVSIGNVLPIYYLEDLHQMKRELKTRDFQLGPGRLSFQ